MIKNFILKLRQRNIEFIYFIENNTVAIYTEKDLDNIDKIRKIYFFDDFQDLGDFFENFRDITFAVRSKFRSNMINPMVGEIIIKRNEHVKVDLKSPDITVVISKFRGKNFFYLEHNDVHGSQ